jgi:hypothetical protein
MSDEEDILFDAMTPLGFRVCVTKGYWKLIVTTKHPVMTGREDDVKRALEQPDEIRQSKSDERVYLFYKAEREAMDLCGVQTNR